jgi:hypothetical protein
MTATETVVRRLPGAAGVRLCVRTRDGYRWIEQMSGSPGAYLGDADLALLAHVAPVGAVTPSRPQLVDPATAVWPLIGLPALVVDSVFATSPVDELAGRLHAIGRFLAALHAVPVDLATGGALARLPRRDRMPAWLSAAPPMAAQAARNRMRLAARAPRLAELAAAQPTVDRPRTLVHGRFSTHQCVPSGESTVILGWREAGIGDPASDVAFLLGELVEALAVAPSEAERLCAGAAAFGAGYGVTDPLALGGFVAERVLDHLALHEYLAGPSSGLWSLLNRTDRCIDAILDSVQADAR